MYEAMIYPSHMVKKKTVGDVTFASSDGTGFHLNKETYKDKSGKIIPKNFIVKFDRGGSGFVIKNLQQKIKIGTGFAIGIIITAGHVVCDPSSHLPDFETFTCKIDKKEFKALFLTSFMKEFQSPMLSETSKNFFVYPGDVALLLLVAKEKYQLTELKIARSTEINFNSEVLLAGYPVKPEDYTYCCPLLRGDDDIIRRDEMIKKAFHYFKHLVYSNGNIIGRSDSLIDINCAGTNGMSGGPVFADNKIIGVYLGGPPLPGQYQLYYINQLVRAHLFSKAFTALKSVKNKTFNLYNQNEYFEKLEITLFKCANLSIKLEGISEDNNIPEFRNVADRIQEMTDNYLRLFFNERLLLNYHAYINAKISDLHSMGANIYGKRDTFISSYDHIERVIGAGQPNIEVYNELQKIIAMLVICEYQLLHEEIPLRIIQSDSFKEIITRYQDLKEKYFFMSLQSEIAYFDKTYTNGIYDMVINYKNPEELIHNVAMFVDHPVFGKISEIIESIDNIKIHKFENPEMMFKYLQDKHIC